MAEKTSIDQGMQSFPPSTDLHIGVGDDRSKPLCCCGQEEKTDKGDSGNERIRLEKYGDDDVQWILIPA